MHSAIDELPFGLPATGSFNDSGGVVSSMSRIWEGRVQNFAPERGSTGTIPAPAVVMHPIGNPPDRGHVNLEPPAGGEFEVSPTQFVDAFCNRFSPIGA